MINDDYNDDDDDYNDDGDDDNNDDDDDDNNDDDDDNNNDDDDDDGTCAMCQRIPDQRCPWSQKLRCLVCSPGTEIIFSLDFFSHFSEIIHL